MNSSEKRMDWREDKSTMERLDDGTKVRLYESVTVLGYEGTERWRINN